MRIWIALVLMAVVNATVNASKPPSDNETSLNLPRPDREKICATHFTFQKRGKLISRPAGMPKPGPYYPTLVKMDRVSHFPYDYALYFSTDHDRGKGGIWLYVCNGIPTDAANWKSYDQTVAEGDFDYLKTKPPANPIFIDTTQGTQTETPHANVIDGTVFMTYHNAGAGHSQSTLLATSRDGVNFARINGDNDSVILDYEPGKDVGNGHTGYFRWRPNPFSSVNYRYVGYSLHGGGDNFHDAMWVSNDAIHWDKVQLFDAIEGHAVKGNRIVRRHGIDVNSITPLGNGEYVAIASIGNRASGARARVLELYEIFIAADGKTLARESRKILPNGPPGAYDEEELDGATTVVIGDTWYLIYVGTKAEASVNTIMGATGTFNIAAPKSTKLSPPDRTRDFHPKD
ncbi:MAG: hypothetical protein P8Z79_06885 [Sedimentisphaerales bacterium]|jgi:hypothetical protein